MTAAIVRVVPKTRVSSLTALLLCATSVCAQPADDPVLDLLKSRGLAPHAAIESVVAPMRTAAADLVMSAMNFLDTRYRRGGNSAASASETSAPIGACCGGGRSPMNRSRLTGRGPASLSAG